MKAVFITFLMIFGSFAMAEDPLEVVMEAYRLVANAESGILEEVQADTASPGDIIVYRAVFTNQGEEPFDSLSPQIPIPGSLVYVEDSAKPLPVKVLLRDGQGVQTFPAVDAITEEPIAPEQYEALLWEVSSLAPGESFSAELRAEVLQD